MANKNQKRHLRGAPASKGGEYAPKDRGDSERKLYDTEKMSPSELYSHMKEVPDCGDPRCEKHSASRQEMSNLLKELDEAIAEGELVSTEMENCTPWRYEELEGELAIIESDIKEISKRIEAAKS